MKQEDNDLYFDYNQEKLNTKYTILILLTDSPVLLGTTQLSQCTYSVSVFKKPRKEQNINLINLY